MPNAIHPRPPLPSQRCRAATITGAITAALLLAGCASVTEQRVESSLSDAGVPPQMASCMAGEWVDRLSTEQIKDVSRFAKRLKRDRERMTVSRLVDHVAAWNDPEAMVVISTSAATCAFR